MVPLRARGNLGAMAMKGYSAFPKAPALLEPHHQIVLCHIQDSRWGGILTPLQRCSQCILQPRTAIKEDLSPDFNPFEYMGRFKKNKNKCNFPSKYWFA